MSENIYLTKSDQELYNPLVKSEEWIITNEQIKNIFYYKNSMTINKIISNLIKKGYLFKIKRGKYLIQQDPSNRPFIKDPYELGLSLYEGYLAFGSALRIYDLIDYESFTIYIVTPRTSKSKTIGQYTLKAVAFGKKATGVTHYKKYYVSTIEKTIFDSLIKPYYAGGYAEVTKAIYQQKKLDWNMLQEYIRKFSSDSMCQKIGYVLDLLKKETSFSIPKTLMQYLKKRVRTKTKLISTQKSKGKYDKNWKIIDNYGKNRILSWWYYG